MPEQQIAAGFQTVEKNVDQRLPGLLGKINHHISAENDLELGAGPKRLHQVPAFEYDHLFYKLLDPVFAFLLAESALKILPDLMLGNLGNSLVAINPPFRLGQCFCGNIGS
jgi:hypothetical protein